MYNKMKNLLEVAGISTSVIVSPPPEFQSRTSLQYKACAITQAARKKLWEIVRGGKSTMKQSSCTSVASWKIPECIVEKKNDGKYENYHTPPFKAKQEDEIIMTSSVIDFDDVQFEPLPWKAEPDIHIPSKIFGFDENGNRIDEETLPKVIYAFPGDTDTREQINKKLFDYQFKKEMITEEEDTAIINQENTDTKLPGTSPCKQPAQQETVEQYLRDIKEHQTSWSRDSGICIDAQTRRKIQNGSYPNGSVDEQKLPKLLRYTWKFKLNKLRKYLSDETKHCKINRQDDKGRTGLHYAASKGCKESLEVLVNIPGIKLDIKDQNDMTPLFKAVEVNSLECVKQLVESGANIGVTCRDGRNVLDYAVQEFGDKVADILAYLLKQNQLSALNKEGRSLTLLHKACLARKNVQVEKVVGLLLANGYEINALEGKGRTPLMLGVMMRRPDIVHVLLQHSADVKCFDDSLKNAISYANKESDCYKLLHRYHGHKRDVAIAHDTSSERNRVHIEDVNL